MEETTQNNLFDLQIDHQSSAYLGETAKWSKFLSIMGFICCGLLIIIGIFFGSMMSSLERFGGGAIGSVWLAMIYIIIAILYFFPCLYLFNFSGKMQVALRNNDQNYLTDAFKNLKSCFKFVGIMTIIVLAFYLIAIIIAVVAGATAMRS